MSGAATVRVLLADRAGAPVAGSTIWVSIAGAAPFTGTAITNRSGIAAFPFRGAGGPYTVHAIATAGGNQLAESTVQVEGNPAPPAGRCAAVVNTTVPVHGVGVELLNPYSHALITQVRPGSIYLIRVSYQPASLPNHVPVTVHWGILTPGHTLWHLQQAYCSSDLLGTNHKDHAFVWPTIWPATHPYWAVGILVAGHRVIQVQVPLHVSATRAGSRG
jgi:hypothetical protein